MILYRIHLSNNLFYRMGNVITNPGEEDEDIKNFLSEKKEEFEGKWDLESKNAELVKYFHISEYNLLK